MLGRIEAVAVAGAASLDITWDDGHSARVDLRDVLSDFDALAPLREAKAFARVTISPDGWSLEWPAGIDFGAPQLRRWADEQAGEAMPAKAFRDWMKAHGLTQERAAQALGLSRRMVAYYLSGEKPIPKTVLLATEGYDARVA